MRPSILARVFERRKFTAFLTEILKTHTTEHPARCLAEESSEKLKDEILVYDRVIVEREREEVHT